MEHTLEHTLEDLIENYSARIENFKHDKEVAYSSETLLNLISNCENATISMLNKFQEFIVSYTSILNESAEYFRDYEKHKEKFANDQLEDIQKLPVEMRQPLIEQTINALKAQDSVFLMKTDVSQMTLNNVVLVTSYIFKPNDYRFKDFTIGTIKIIIETLLQKGPLEEFIILFQETFFTGKSNSLKEMNDNLATYENYIKVCHSWINAMEQILENSKDIFK